MKYCDSNGYCGVVIAFGRKFHLMVQWLMGYMDTLGCSEGWLVAFDCDNKKSWSEKIDQETETVNGKTVNIFGC